MALLSEKARLQPGPVAARFNAWLCGMLGYLVLAAGGAVALSLLTWSMADPSLMHSASGPVTNALGPVGAIIADLVMQLLGLAGVFVLLPLTFWALQLISNGRLDRPRTKLLLAPLAVLLLASAASSLPNIAGWSLHNSVGGMLGDFLLANLTSILARIRPERASAAAGLFCVSGGALLLLTSLGLSRSDLKLIFQRPKGFNLGLMAVAWRRLGEMSERAVMPRREPVLRMRATGAFPPAPPFDPPAPVFGHAPQPFDPADLEAACGTRPRHGTDDIDPKELKHILSICAPLGAGKGVTPGPDLLLAQDQEPDDRPLQAEPSRPVPRPMPRASAENGLPPAPQQRTARGAAWPAPEPSPPRASNAPPADGWRPQSLPGGDDLYGRAVTIVLDDRKASADYLQQRLRIGFMRATDLIERMEREGILGAPVYNGMRPILIGGPGSREV